MLLGYGRVALYTTSSGGFRVVPRVTWNPPSYNKAGKVLAESKLYSKQLTRVS